MRLRTREREPGAEGDFQTAAGAASQPGGAAALSRSPSAAASAGPQRGHPQGRSAHRNNSYLSLQGVRQAGFAKRVLPKRGQSYVPHAKVEAPHILMGQCSGSRHGFKGECNQWEKHRHGRR